MYSVVLNVLIFQFASGAQQGRVIGVS